MQQLIIVIIGLVGGLIVTIYSVYCMMNEGLTGKNRWITKQEHPIKFYFIVGIMLMYGIVSTIIVIHQL